MKLDFDYCSRSNEQIAYVGGRDESDAAYRVRAIHDEDGENPREWCNVSTMVCSHRRYNLGDYKTGLDDAKEAIRQSRDYRDTWEETESGYFRLKGETMPCLDLSDAGDCYRAMRMCSDIVVRPLFLYDHSGLAISTSGFSCPWDSGQVGFAFITLAKIREETKHRTITKAARKWACDAIDSEVDCYDDYLRGNCWGYIAERAPIDADEREDNDAWEEIDSCWGFLGDPEKSGLAEQAIDAIEYDQRQTKARRFAKLKDLIKANAPLAARAAVLSAMPL